MPLTFLRCGFMQVYNEEVNRAADTDLTVFVQRDWRVVDVTRPILMDHWHVRRLYDDHQTPIFMFSTSRPDKLNKFYSTAQGSPLTCYKSIILYCVSSCVWHMKWSLNVIRSIRDTILSTLVYSLRISTDAVQKLSNPCPRFGLESAWIRSARRSMAFCEFSIFFDNFRTWRSG